MVLVLVAAFKASNTSNELVYVGNFQLQVLSTLCEV